MEMDKGFWDQKTFCMITGASRGIGKTIAIEFSKHVADGSVFLLVARSEANLKNTKESIEQVNPSCKVLIQSLDLEKPDADTYYKLIESSANQGQGTKSTDFDQILLVHNAGSLGNISLKVLQYENVSELESYYSMNLISLIILTSQFFKVFNDSTKQRNIVQISSLGALEPFKTWGGYCAGKAARDMLMRSIHAEEPSIHTFNYAPGPVETDIFEEAVTQTGDNELKEYFTKEREAGRILTSEQTVNKLIRLLGEKKYIKGEHIDYYDVE